MLARVVLVCYSMACALLAGGLGLAYASLRTDAGRGIVLRYTVKILNENIHGSAAVGKLGGSITGGIELFDVVIADEGGVPLLDLPQVSVRYRASDLMSGRVVLGQLKLTSPVFQITRYPDGSLNFTEVLRLGGGGTGPAPLIAFNDVEITDGTLVFRTPLDDLESVLEWDSIAGFPMRVRRFENIQGMISYLRLSSPEPTENAILVEINSLTVGISDPRIEIESLVGVVEVGGDSLRLDLEEFNLPNTRATVQGAVTWTNGPALFDLDIIAEQVASQDLPLSIVPFPTGLSGSGRFIIKSGADMLAVHGERLDLRGAGGGGRVSGRFGFEMGPDGQWAADSTDLRFDNFDIEYFKHVLDSLPLHGRLTGVLLAHGPRQAIATSIDWNFLDSLAGWDQSWIAGSGTVAIGGVDGFSFDRFMVTRGSFALSTIRLLVPAVELAGTLVGQGELNGPWLEPLFVGTFRHQDGAGATSRVTGSVRLDALGPTLGVWAELTLDSLDVEGLRGTYPGIPLYGSFTGSVSLDGFLDSLSFVTDMIGRRGRIVASGALRLDSMIGFHKYTARFTDVEFMRVLVDSLPATRVSGLVEGDLLSDSAVVSAAIDIRLRQSTLNGFLTDSVTGHLTISDGVLTVDSLSIWIPGGAVSVSGTLGLQRSERGEIRVVAAVDPLRSGLEFFTWLLGSPEVDGKESIRNGSFDAEFVVSGNLFDYAVEGSARSEAFGWGPLFFGGAELTGKWVSAANRVSTISARLDSVAVGRMAFSDLAMRAAGTSDSVSWFARARLGIDASWLAGGSWIRHDSGSVLPVDSMALLVPSDVWFMQEPKTFYLSERGAEFENVVMEGAMGGSSIVLDGSFFPAGGSYVEGTVDGLSVEDVLALLQLDRRAGAGRISGEITLAGSMRNPEYHLALGVSGGRWGGFPVPDLRSIMDYRDRTLSIDLATFRMGLPEVTLQGTLPLDLGLAGVTRREVPGELDLTAKAQNLSVSFVDGIFSTIRSADGYVEANVHVAGTWDSPELSGSVSIRDGRAIFPSIRVRYSNINGSATLSGDTIYVDSISVTSGEGKAFVSGYVRLEDLTQPILALDLVAKDFRALNIPNFLELTGSADLHFSGPVIGAHVTGRGEVSHGVLYFADLFEKNIIDFDDPLLIGLIDTTLASVIREQGLGAAFSTRFLDSLYVDSVVVDMGNDMWMQSQEANIAVAGNILAGKVGPRYRLDGTLNTPRGTYQLPNIRHSFRVTSGEIRYLGTPDLDAVMSVSAEHVLRARTGETVKIFVNLGGTLYLPEVRLSSDITPPIPETEIVAYLISGSPSFQAGESVRRAAFEMVGALSGELSVLITDLGVPIDFLRIRPTETNDGDPLGISGAELTAGFQLLDSRLFVSASQLACPNRQNLRGEWGLGVEFRMSQEMKFSLSRDPLRGCDVSGPTTNPLSYQLGVDFFWEKKY